jgi:hypothetical protein
MKSLDRILAMSDEQRRRLRLYCRARRRKEYECRLHFTRDELMDYLRKNDFRTRQKLEHGRKKGDPRLCDYLGEFGSWGKAVCQVFGKKEMPRSDAEYLIKTVVQFNLWTPAKYMEAHRLRPDIVPSKRQVNKRWGGFKNMFVYAKRYSLGATMEQYLKLRRRLGRSPTNTECDTYGVKLNKAISIFKSKKRFDSFVKDMETMEDKCAGERRSP